MLKRCVALVFATFAVAAAPILPSPSQPPANSQRAETPREHHAQHPTADQRGTDKSPISVKLVRTEDDKTEAKRQKTERDGQAVTEKKLAVYTWYLALATVALAFVAAAQAGLFVWQLLYMRQGLRDAAEAASAATKQAGIAQATFEKLERPYLYVYAASHLEGDFQKHLFDCYVTYLVANFGKLPATIRRATAELAISDTGDPRGAPNKPTKSAGDGIFAKPIFAPGKSRHIDTVADKDDLPHEVREGKEAVPRLGADESVFLWVVIEYDGPFTKGHQTSACWRLSDDRFQQHGGDAYNYIC